MSNACPICAGLGSGSGNAAGDAAKKFDDLVTALGSSGSAATHLENILQKLTTAEAATAAAAKIAAQTGYKAADVRRAMAAQAKEAADAIKAAAALEREAEKERRREAKEAAALEKQTQRDRDTESKAAATLAESQKKAKALEQKKADEAIMAESLRMMKVRDERIASEAAKKTEAQEKAAALTSKATDALKGEAAAATRTGGALGLIQRALGMLGPKGQAAAAAIGVIVIVATAAAVALRRLMSAAIEASQEAQRLRESFGAFFGTGARGGARFMAELDAVAKKLPYTGAQIRAMAQPLIDARLRGAQLARSIEAVAAATAMMGESGGSAATGLIKQLAQAARFNQATWISPEMLEQFSQAGVSAEVLARELGVSQNKLQLSTVRASVLGDVLQRVLIRQGAGSLALLGQSWDAITAKVSEGISSAFGGLGDIVAPFMEEVRLLSSELFKGSAGTQALGGVLRAVLEPAFRVATAGVRALHYGLLYVEIAALRAYIWARPMLEWLSKTGITSFLAKTALVMLGLAILPVVAGFGLLGLAIALSMAPLLILGAAIAIVVVGLYMLGSAVVGAVSSSLAGLGTWAEGAAKSATDFIRGLVDKISNGAGEVRAAVTRLAREAISALNSALMIKSPSRLTAAAGAYFVQGFTGTVEAGQDDAAQAGGGLGSAAATGLTRTAKSGKGSGGDGRGKLADNIVFNYTGPADDFPRFRDMANRWLEELAASGPEPETA